MDKAVNDNVARLHGGVIQVTFHDNVFSCLNLSFTIWAAGREVGEESLFVFSNRDMASSYVSELST